MSEHIRHNLWGIVAVFIALGGTAVALPGKNVVDSGDIKAGNVRLSDIAPNAVDSSKVVDNSLTGADIQESTLDLPAPPTIPSSLPPSGPAGGDLSGQYPDPQVLESGLTTGGDLSGPVSNAQLGPNTVGDPELSDRTRRILIPVSDLNPPVAPTGATAPAFAVLPEPINPVAAAFALLFDANNAEVVTFATRVPDDRVPGSDIQIDLDWSPAADAVGSNAEVVWDAEFGSYGLNDDVTPSSSSGQLTATTTAGQQDHLRTTTLTRSGSTITNGDVLFVEIFRAAANAADDLPVDAQLHFISIRYTATG